MTHHPDPASGCGWLVIIAAAFLASVILVAAGFVAGQLL